MLQVTSCK